MSAPQRIREASLLLHARTTAHRAEQVRLAPTSTRPVSDRDRDWDMDTILFSVASLLSSTAHVLEQRGVNARMTIAEYAALSLADRILGRAV